MGGVMTRKTRNGNETRRVVLEAAREAFAEKGFAGTSLAAVSARCGISEGLILHHFKSKEALYAAVLKDLADGYGATLAEAGQGSLDQEGMADSALRAAFRFWSGDTAYNRISLWSHLERRDELADAEARVTTGLAQALARLQSKGKVDSRFQPVALMAMTIGPIHFWLRYRRHFKKHLGLKGSEAELDALFLEQYLGLVKKMYEPADGGGPARKGA
jgi:TetR/AcrR family transcriptional regulator